MSGRSAHTAVLVPMKTFSAAKSRLRTHFADSARQQLAHDMFESVLSAARTCPVVDTTYVLTNGDDVARVARAQGARVLRDPDEHSGRAAALGSLIDWGLAQLTSHGVTRALVLMADLPRVTPDDVGALCAALVTHEIVAAADQHGRSTNALGVRLPCPMLTAFGDPDSYARHLASARLYGWRVSEIVNPRLAHDVDRPDDVAGAAAFGN